MIYLLHFSQPIGNLTSPLGQAQHYLGWTDDLDNRIREHRKGNPKASKLCAFAARKGIKFTVAEVVPGDRTLERRLKNHKRAKDFCPVCQRR